MSTRTAFCEALGHRRLLQYESTRGDRGPSGGGGGVFRRAVAPRVAEAEQGLSGVAAEFGGVSPSGPSAARPRACNRNGAGLEMAVQQEDWENAAAYASNLSELEATLGKLSEALADARQSIIYAVQSGDVDQTD